MYSITFNGQNSADLGIFLKSQTRSLKSEYSIDRKKLIFKNGTINYGNSFENIEIVFKATLLENDYFERRKKTREIAKWLHQPNWSELTLYDEAGVFYKAISVSQINTSILEVTDEFDIAFECKPFKYSLLDRDTLLGDNILLGQNVNLGTSFSFDFTTNGTAELEIDSTVEIDEYNIIIQANSAITSVKIGNMVLSNLTEGQYIIGVSNKIVYKIVESGIENQLQEFNKVWDTIDITNQTLSIPVEFVGLTGTCSITFNLQNTYL